MYKLRRILGVGALFVGLGTAGVAVTEGVAAASWSCNVYAFNSGHNTGAGCQTDTPPHTRGWVQAMEQCRNSVGTYWIYGGVAIAPFNDAYAASVTGSCGTATVVARTLNTGVVNGG